MMFRQIIILGSVIGLAIVAATALVAVRLLAPKPPISTTSNNEITHQVANTISSTTEFIGGTSNTNPTIDVHPNTKVPVTTVRVGTFYDGQDGYSLSIPSGNSSTCIWNYTGGTGAIPGSETTHARSATEKHTIYTNPFLYDWEVTCVDDFGNRYIGVFPSSS